MQKQMRYFDNPGKLEMGFICQRFICGINCERLKQEEPLLKLRVLHYAFFPLQIKQTSFALLIRIADLVKLKFYKAMNNGLLCHLAEHLLRNENIRVVAC